MVSSTPEPLPGQAPLTACPIVVAETPDAQPVAWVSSVGIDTISLAWPPGPASTRLGRWRRGGTLVSPATGEITRFRPGKRGVQASIGDVSIGVFDTGTLWLEGRAAAFLGEGHALIAPSRLGSVRKAAVGLLAAMGVVADPAESWVRRADLAGDLSFHRPADGLAFLRALASLDVPRHRRDLIVADDGTPQTVYLRTPRRGSVKLRAYDKGVESGTAQPGRRVRVERQVRYERRAGGSVEEFAAADLAALWIGNLSRWAGAATGQFAASLNDAQETVLGAWRLGALSNREAERLLGTLAVMRAGASREMWSAPTLSRRRGELRELGISLSTTDAPGEAVNDVPVGELLARLRDAWTT
jgi:hypothetical protein